MFGSLIGAGGNSGLAMMVRAVGIDPETIMGRVSEFETFAKNFGVAVHTRVAEISKDTAALKESQESMAEQLYRIENLLICLTNQNAQIGGPVTPAGDSWENVSESDSQAVS